MGGRNCVGEGKDDADGGDGIQLRGENDVSKRIRFMATNKYVLF